MVTLLVIAAKPSAAAEKQGGGAFSVPKANVEAKPPRKKKTQPSPRVTVNYDGLYKIRFSLHRQYIGGTPCLSGSRDLKISKHRTRLQVVPVVGDTIGGDVRNGALEIYLVKAGAVTDNFQYSGRIKLSERPGQTTSGFVTGKDKSGAGCDWRVQLTRQ